jgi:hypothetical protein
MIPAATRGVWDAKYTRRSIKVRAGLATPPYLVILATPTTMRPRQQRWSFGWRHGGSQEGTCATPMRASILSGNQYSHDILQSRKSAEQPLHIISSIGPPLAWATGTQIAHSEPITSTSGHLPTPNLEQIRLRYCFLSPLGAY